MLNTRLELTRSVRAHNEELGEVRKKFEDVDKRLEEKASKTYTVFHLENCIQKEAFFEVK